MRCVCGKYSETRPKARLKSRISAVYPCSLSTPLLHHQVHSWNRRFAPTLTDQVTLIISLQRDNVVTHAC